MTNKRLYTRIYIYIRIYIHTYTHIVANIRGYTLIYVCICIHIYHKTVPQKSLVIIRSISLACKDLLVVRPYRLRYDANDVSMAKPTWCKQTKNVIPIIVICRNNVLYVKYQSLVSGTSRRLLSSESLLPRGTSRG